MKARSTIVIIMSMLGTALFIGGAFDDNEIKGCIIQCTGLILSWMAITAALPKKD